MEHSSHTQRHCSGAIAVVTALACTLLVACVDLRYTRVALDSPPPVFQPISCAPQAVSVSSGVQAAPFVCDVLVRADAWFTDSQLPVSGKGERYCFEVPPGQVWFDKSIRAVPPAPIAQTGIHEAAAKIKLLRHPESGFMALMAGVAPDPRAREVRQAIDLSKPQKCIIPVTSGTLVLYPNDAVGRGPDADYFYANNHGQIWVRITRR